jgi:hypothetical protein
MRALQLDLIARRFARALPERVVAETGEPSRTRTVLFDPNNEKDLEFAIGSLAAMVSEVNPERYYKLSLPVTAEVAARCFGDGRAVSVVAAFDCFQGRMVARADVALG